MIAIFITKQEYGSDEYSTYCGVEPFQNKVNQDFTDPKLGERLTYRHALIGNLNLVVCKGDYSTKIDACRDSWSTDAGRSRFLGLIYAPYSIVRKLGMNQSDDTYLFYHMARMPEIKKRERDAETILNSIPALRSWKLAMLSWYDTTLAEIFPLAPQRLKLPESCEEVQSLYNKLRNAEN